MKRCDSSNHLMLAQQQDDVLSTRLHSSCWHSDWFCREAVLAAAVYISQLSLRLLTWHYCCAVLAPQAA
jgi:hypothetical protein